MKRLTFVLGIVAAFVLVGYAGWRLHRWRQAEEEKRLRRIETLTETIKSHPAVAPETPDEVDG